MFSIIGLVCVEAAAFLCVTIFRVFHGSFLGWLNVGHPYQVFVKFGVER